MPRTKVVRARYQPGGRLCNRCKALFTYDQLNQMETRHAKANRKYFCNTCVWEFLKTMGEDVDAIKVAYESSYDSPSLDSCIASGGDRILDNESGNPPATGGPTGMEVP